MRSKAATVLLIVIEVLRCCHAHPQLPLSLFRLHLQRLDRIAQPLLLRPQLLVLHLLHGAHCFA
jgi:hypothetical protein